MLLVQKELRGELAASTAEEGLTSSSALEGEDAEAAEGELAPSHAGEGSTRVSAVEGQGAIAEEKQDDLKLFHDYTLTHIADYSIKAAFISRLSMRVSCSDEAVNKLIDKKVHEASLQHSPARIKVVSDACAKPSDFMLRQWVR